MQGVNIGVNKHHPLTKWSATFMDLSCLANSAVWSGFWKIMTPMNEEWKRQAQQKKFQNHGGKLLTLHIAMPQGNTWELTELDSITILCLWPPSKSTLSIESDHASTQYSSWLLKQRRIRFTWKIFGFCQLFNLMASLWVNFWSAKLGGKMRLETRSTKRNTSKLFQGDPFEVFLIGPCFVKSAIKPCSIFEIYFVQTK